MNLQGGQRGGAGDLACHLLKSENEHVDVHELRGFVSDDLKSALHEAYAVSRGTRAKQFLFSVSLNPPKTENVTIAEYEDAINRVEERFGLTGQPRAIVFHEKKGRRHAHAVWSRIDSQKMKAIPLPYTRRGLKELSRELYLQHGWTMPQGYMKSSARNPLNFTMAQWQQAKRSGKDPREIKAALQDCWAVSDTQAAFTHALKERGYTLAKGDQRGFVAIDHRCNIFSVSKKWVGANAKEVRAKLTDAKTLPSANEAKSLISRNMTQHLKGLATKQHEAIHKRLTGIEKRRKLLIKQQSIARANLMDNQKQRSTKESYARQKRFNSGWRGLFDRITGKAAHIRKQIEHEAAESSRRDEKEKDQLIFQHLNQRQALQARIDRLASFAQKRKVDFDRDLQQYHDIEEGRKEYFARQNSEPDYER